MTSDAGNWTAVCSLDRLAQQGIVCARVSGVDLIVIGDGERVHACERACPHEQADLSLGRIADGRLHCPRHMAWFNLDDGAIQPGWPSRPLRRYGVRVADGLVWVNPESVPNSIDSQP